jgi:hypothetical protein
MDDDEYDHNYIPNCGVDRVFDDDYNDDKIGDYNQIDEEELADLQNTVPFAPKSQFLCQKLVEWQMISKQILLLEQYLAGNSWPEPHPSRPNNLKGTGQA